MLAEVVDVARRCQHESKHVYAVLVNERASNSAVAGPSDQGLAVVMGRNEQQWHKQYDN